MLLATMALVTTPAHAAQSPQLAPAWTVVLPFGGPQFAEGRRTRGLVFGGLQLAGASLTVTSIVQMRSLAEAGDIDAELRWRMTSAGAMAFTTGCWFGSTLDASRYREIQQEQLLSAGLAWYRVTAGT